MAREARERRSAPVWPLPGPLGEELRWRLSRASATAQELLGLPVDPTGGADPVRRHELIAGLSELLAATPAHLAGGDVGAGAGRAVQRVHVRASDRQPRQRRPDGGSGRLLPGRRRGRSAGAGEPASQ